MSPELSSFKAGHPWAWQPIEVRFGPQGFRPSGGRNDCQYHGFTFLNDIHVYIYIFIFSVIDLVICVCTFVYLYVYVYIYIGIGIVSYTCKTPQGAIANHLCVNEYMTYIYLYTYAYIYRTVYTYIYI